MKEVLKYVPGFRSDRKRNKIIATIYYALCLIMLTSGVGEFLTYAAIPFIVFSIISIVKKRREKTVILTLIGAILIFSLGSALTGPTVETVTTSKKAEVVTKKVVAPVVKEKTPEEIKIEADAKIKADADAKVIAAQKVKDDAAAKIIADKKAIEDKKIAAAKAIVDAQIAKKAAYQAWIDAQFSPWDGKHTYLVDLVKENLNDDKSFKHVETTYADKGTYLIIKMKYRAANAFGGIILQNVTAKADYKTNQITITSQND